MNSLITGSSKDGDYIALVITKEEEELLKQLIQDKNKEFLFRDIYPIKNIVGIGDPSDTDDVEIKKYIRFRLRDYEKLYACHCPHEHYLVNHYNAISSWQCAVQALKYPRHLVLILAPRIIDSTQTEKYIKPTPYIS